MSLILQNPLSNPTHRMTKLTIPKPPKCTIINYPFQFSQKYEYPCHQNPILLHNRHVYTKAYEYDTPITFTNEAKPAKLQTFDVFLSLLESLCLISSLVISVGSAVSWVFFRQYNMNNGLVLLGNKLLVWLLAGAVAAGSIIRRRQWSRVCGGPSAKVRPGFESGSVIERIEKLEESMKSATTIIRTLSRQLEKLGVRFRVTRKSLKDPIAETAALAQKNSEVTRALAAQEDLLERELGEVQKVLLAMQEQQQKQLELILAIAQSGKLFNTKRAPTKLDSKNTTDSNNGSKPVDGQQIQTISEEKDASNSKVGGS